MNNTHWLDGYPRLQSGWRVVIRLWEWCTDLARVVFACRFSTFFVLVGFGFFVLAGQGREFLRAFGDSSDDALYRSLHTGCFLFSILIWVTVTWVTSVALLSRHEQLGPASRIAAMKARVPRALALCCAGSIMAGSAIMEQWWLVAAVASLALVFCAVSRRLDDFLHKLLATRRTFRLALPWHSGDNARVLARKAIAIDDLALGMLGVLILSWVLFALFAWFPVVLPQMMGAPAILLFASSSWIVFGNFFLTFVPRLMKAPTLSGLLLLWVLVISSCNDNHAIRTLPKPAIAVTPSTVEQHFQGWIKAREGTRDPAKPYPIVIVAAAGGGIRAAYWTATLLAEIQQKHPQFKDHVFAISGVSGGSVGAAVFTSLLAENAGKGARLCTVNDTPVQDPVPCAAAVLSGDFLSPAAGALLYSDLFQRFLPWRVESFDRARALEGAWEHAWRARVGGMRFAESFDNLWEKDLRYRIPALLLNGTWVETGQRIIMSNLSIDANTFNDAADARAKIGKPVPLSTAAHLSARFTYVSPAGTFMDGGKAAGHIVDGGYYENTGAATAWDVLYAVVRYAQSNNIAVAPIVIDISNDPGQLECTPLAQTDALTWAGELRAPVEALLNTRNARGAYSQSLLREYVANLAEDTPGVYISFGLVKSTNDPPLGWFLSAESRKSMDAQRGLDANQKKIGALSKLLQGDNTAFKCDHDKVTGSTCCKVAQK